MARRNSNHHADAPQRPRGRPKRETAPQESFTSTKLKKHVTVWRTMKRGSAEANTRLSEHVRTAISDGAPRLGLRILYQLLQRDHAEAEAILEWVAWAYPHAADDRQGDLVRNLRQQDIDQEATSPLAN